MKKLLIEPGEGGVPHVLYDISIEDITERRQKRRGFRTGNAAANFLGVPPGVVAERRCNGHRITSKKDGRKYAIRIATEKDKAELKFEG